MKRRWLCALLAAVLIVSTLSGLSLRTGAVETMTTSQQMIDVIKDLRRIGVLPVLAHPLQELTEPELIADGKGNKAQGCLGNHTQALNLLQRIKS